MSSRAAKRAKASKPVEKVPVEEASDAWVQDLWGTSAVEKATNTNESTNNLHDLVTADCAARKATECGILEINLSGGAASATRLYHKYPLRLLCPKRVVDGTKYPDASDDSVWCYQVSFGGGLVAGDRVGMTVDVNENLCCVLATQGTNKVYKHLSPGSNPESKLDDDSDDGDSDDDADAIKNPIGDLSHSAHSRKTNRTTVQALAGRVERNALLAVLPDPTQAFRDAKFKNTNRFVLRNGGSLVCVDWCVAGRAAFKGGGGGGFVSGRGGGTAPGEDQTLLDGLDSGERWRFAKYETNTEIFSEVENGHYAELCSECTVLLGDRVGTLAKRMGTTHALATVFLIGRRCADTVKHATVIISEITKKGMAGGGKGVFVGEGGACDSTGEGTTEHCTGNTEDWLLASIATVPPPANGNENDGGVILRIAAPSTDAVYHLLREVLAPLANELGALPFSERGLS